KSIPASQWPLIGRTRQTNIGATGFGQFSSFPARLHTKVGWMLGSSKTDLFRKPIEQVNAQNGPKQRGQNTKKITLSTPTSANHTQVSPVSVIPPWATDRVETVSLRVTRNAPTETPDTERRVRPPLISAYRGEMPQRSKSHSELDGGTSRPYRKGVFQVNTSTRNQAPYYIINPEWMSEAMTIQRLGLIPRRTQTVSTSKPSRKKNDCSNNVRRTEHDARRSNIVCDKTQSPTYNRCQSVPARAVNPITWEPWNNERRHV
ncbi:hypothetical protein EG68_08488, partial [Paragonimus skrjabini miyazakii]